jgi:hypothetical protein
MPYWLVAEDLVSICDLEVTAKLIPVKGRGMLQ